MPDAEAAKRAYDWCKENCDWFKYSGTTLYRFSLNENQFLKESQYDDLGYPTDFDWLEEAAKQTKAECLVASSNCDYTAEEIYGDEEDDEAPLWRSWKLCPAETTLTKTTGLLKDSAVNSLSLSSMAALKSNTEMHTKLPRNFQTRTSLL
ncbi:MAG: hypothetical protein IKN82_04895 [Treponema sp.]|nr:hypothetical protein [Treponema sp.]